MSEQNQDTAQNPETTEIPDEERTFLCVVDDSPELAAALRFASRRASRSGRRLALLYVIAPAEGQLWAAVGDLMEQEKREEAEEILQTVAQAVQVRTGVTPALYIREGTLTEEVLNLINEERSISLLVLGAATGTEGPGPLVTNLVETRVGALRIPVTVVPGSLSEKEIDAIT